MMPSIEQSQVVNSSTEQVNLLAQLIHFTVNFTSNWAPSAILFNEPSKLKQQHLFELTNYSLANKNQKSNLINCTSSSSMDCNNIHNNNLLNDYSSQDYISGNLNFDLNPSDFLQYILNVSLVNNSLTNEIATSNNNNISDLNGSILLSQNHTKTPTLSSASLQPDLRVHHPLLAVVLAMICIVVVFGNTLTMISVWKVRYLHTVTNYFVASLAAADCLVGAIVMPFSVVHEVMNKWWIFGPDWCDLWRSFDVLASTASILHLCVISLGNILPQIYSI